MATVPTGRLERELRKLYLRWVSGLPRHEHDMSAYIRKFQQDSERLIQRTGGDIARLGSYLADFPAPKELALDPVVGHVYDQMQQAAVQASIMTGLNSREAARAMLRAGLDKSYRRLERVARTETVRAYWKNQWDSTAGLGLVMVWSAESGPRTCDYCLSRDGLVVEDPNIRDHPNGRCTLLPMHPSRVAYKGTLQPDGSVTMDDSWRTPSETLSSAMVGVAEAASGASAGWRPTMSRADAEAWSKDSALPGAFYHGTSSDAYESIRVSGFDTGRTTVGNYGAGTYLTPQQNFAETYARQKNGAVIETRVLVKNPADYREIRATRGAEMDEFVMDRIDEGMVPEDAMSEWFKQEGFDAVVVRSRGEIRELLVFSAEQVVVVV